MQELRDDLALALSGDAIDHEDDEDDEEDEDEAEGNKRVSKIFQGRITG